MGCINNVIAFTSQATAFAGHCLTSAKAAAMPYINPLTAFVAPYLNSAADFVAPYASAVYSAANPYISSISAFLITPVGGTVTAAVVTAVALVILVNKLKPEVEPQGNPQGNPQRRRRNRGEQQRAIKAGHRQTQQVKTQQARADASKGGLGLYPNRNDTGRRGPNKCRGGR